MALTLGTIALALLTRDMAHNCLPYPLAGCVSHHTKEICGSKILRWMQLEENRVAVKGEAALFPLLRLLSQLIPICPE